MQQTNYSFLAVSQQWISVVIVLRSIKQEGEFEIQNRKKDGIFAIWKTMVRHHNHCLDCLGKERTWKLTLKSSWSFMYRWDMGGSIRVICASKYNFPSCTRGVKNKTRDGNSISFFVCVLCFSTLRSLMYKDPEGWTTRDLCRRGRATWHGISLSSSTRGHP